MMIPQHDIDFIEWTGSKTVVIPYKQDNFEEVFEILKSVDGAFIPGPDFGSRSMSDEDRDAFM